MSPPIYLSIVASNLCPSCQFAADGPVSATPLRYREPTEEGDNFATDLRVGDVVKSCTITLVPIRSGPFRGRHYLKATVGRFDAVARYNELPPGEREGKLWLPCPCCTDDLSTRVFPVFRELVAQQGYSIVPMERSMEGNGGFYAFNVFSPPVGPKQMIGTGMPNKDWVEMGQELECPFHGKVMATEMEMVGP